MVDYLLMKLFADKEANKEIVFRDFILDFGMYPDIKNRINAGQLYDWMEDELQKAHISFNECWIKFRVYNSEKNVVEDYSDEILHFVR